MQARRVVAIDTVEFEFSDPSGNGLPEFEAGAHINVFTPGGLIRSYSLTGSPSQRQTYSIAVKRSGSGRGGSVSMVDRLSPGDTIRVLNPNNAFKLVDADHYLFIAGGIGITPILSMMSYLIAVGRENFKLVNITADPASTPFLERLSAPPLLRHLNLFHTREHGRPDLWPFLQDPADTHIYCCGSEGLMDDVRLLSTHWPAEAVHFEHFVGVDSIGASSHPFRVRRAGSGQVFEVAHDMTILDTLFRAGIQHPVSCAAGTCGTCKMRLISGEADHRDLFLADEERAEFIMPCVSRALGDEIELDF